MSVKLVIRDGNPWWESPDIWVVPGGDPNGIPGGPVAGEQAFIWARVHNQSEENFSSARVNFYWSNPAIGVLRSKSTLVGSSFVDLNPAEIKDVLCVSPWIPVIVNDGHECVVAEVIHPNDPLLSPLPDEFDPPTYHQIAQKNLSVLNMKRSRKIMPIQLAASIRMARRVSIKAELGGTLDKNCLTQLGLKGYEASKSHLIKSGLSTEVSCDEWEKEMVQNEMELHLKAGTAKAIYLNVWSEKLAPQTYVLLRVISCNETKEDGGITYVLINEKKEE